MRKRLRSVKQRCRQRIRSLGTVRVNVTEPPSPCPLCVGRMGVQKTVLRSGRTLEHGPFKARETVHVCTAKCRWPSGVLVTRTAACLNEALVPGCNVGYDVMVFVGLQRFLHHQQREEIQATLSDKYCISISAGTVSSLSRRFAQYVARLHHGRATLLRAALDNDGGWPLHVDATGEAGRGTLLVAMAGWRKWVLGSWKISTERVDLILPPLRETVRLFGPPCAVMRDLGKAMIPATADLVSELEPTIPVLACHQHLLADVGKDLLDPAHAELRALFRRTKVRPKLRALVRELGRRLGRDIKEAREAVLRWQSVVEAGHRIEAGRDGLATVRALAQWILDYKAQATGLDFPFDQPYLDLYDRCMTALRASDAFLRHSPPDKYVTAALRRLHRYIEPVACKVPFGQVTERIRRRTALFNELRGVLRMGASIPNTETKQDLDLMREQLDELVVSLDQRRPARGPTQDTRKAIDIIVKHIKTHGDNLWGHAIHLPDSAGAGVRLVSRTNWLAENFFGELKHDERRRSGRKNLGQDLEHLPAEAALVCNLKHDDYVSIVCGSLDRLAETFAELDREERERKLNGGPQAEQEDGITNVLQITSASLSPADRRVIRTKEMDHRIAVAAKSRAPRYRC